MSCPHRLFAPLIAALAVMGGCRDSAPDSEKPALADPSPCAQVDESDLKQVIGCYYAAGAFQWDRTWRFVSAKTRAEISRSDWEPGLIPTGRFSLDGTFSGGPCTEVAATVHARRGPDRARVQRVRDCARPNGEVCRLTQTNTWVREEGAWRHLVHPKTARAVGDHWNQGRYAVLGTAAAAWARREPDSVNALKLLGWSVMRGQGDTSADARRAIIARIKALNPADSEARLIAASIAPTLSEAVATLATFRKGDCFGALVAANTSLRADTAAERLAIIDGSEFADDLAMTRLEALFELKRHAEARKLLASDDMKQQLRALTSQDPAFRAGWGLRVGEVAAALGEHERARPWLLLALDFPDAADRARELLKR